MSLDDGRREHFDEMDAILNDYDRSLDEILGAADNAQHNNPRSAADRPPEELGIDEEVKVQKNRKRAPKLDETLLSSANGIPKLQKISKSRLKFRGKGHEFSDVAWLLGTYQVWLHELYPRAKFADGLIMIEKLGHAKRMQKLRCGWIDESKPKKAQENDSDHENLSVTPHPELQANPSPRQSNLQTPDIESVLHAAETLSTENENEPMIDAGTNGQNNSDNISFTGAPEDDELDQLLAEEPMFNGNPSRNSSTSAGFLNAGNGHVGVEDVFAEEEEIMRELDFP